MAKKTPAAVEPKFRVIKTIMVPPENLIIDDSKNGRRYPVEPGDMTMSLVNEGQKSPIHISKPSDPALVEAGKWTLVFGYKRAKAAIEINESHLTPEPFQLRAEVIEIDEAEVLAHNMIENMDREPLKPMDFAHDVDQLETAGMDRSLIAARLHKSQSWVSKVRALLDLPAKMQRDVQSGTVSMEQGYQLTLMDDDDREKQYAKMKESSKRISRTDLKKARREASQKKGVETHNRRSTKEIREDFYSLAHRGEEEDATEKRSKSGKAEDLGLLLLQYVDGRRGFKYLVGKIEEAIG